jgi:3'(2'), 5'-bisphosphate nucleotidase
MTLRVDQGFTEQLMAIAQAAGDAILAIYNAPETANIQTKNDDSPLTAADLSAHQLIVRELPKLLGVPVLSEESQIPSLSERQAWATYWLVDPLDGTKEFVARTNDFTVNIALVVDHQAVLGILHAPYYGLTYMAAKGCGAWLIDQHGQKQRLTTAKQLTPPRLLVSRFHANGKKNQALLQHTQQRFGDYQVLEVGSALKMCRIAEGLADFYPRFGTTMEWDTAAGQIILEEAGGALVDRQGRPFLYNKRESLANKDFIVVGDKAYVDDWLACMQVESAR